MKRAGGITLILIGSLIAIFRIINFMHFFSTEKPIGNEANRIGFALGWIAGAVLVSGIGLLLVFLGKKLMKRAN